MELPIPENYPAEFNYANPALLIEAPKRSKWYKFIHWEYLPLLVIVIVTVVLHFLSINRPTTIVWDETWYVKDAQNIIAERTDLRPEHPALGKLFVVTGIKAFGDNSFGWRFFSVVFGTANIFLIYFICKKLKLSWKASVAATFLMALDDMTFVHSGLALLDVYEVTFLLAGFLLYLHAQYLPMSIAFTLSALCKLVGVFGLIAVAAHWLLFRRDKWKSAIGSVVLAAVAFVAFTVLFDYFITGTFVNPVTRIKDMLVLTSINKFTDPPLSISSRPWTWLYPFIYPYTNAIVYSYDPQYISFISHTIQLLIVPVFIYLIIKAVKGSSAARFALVWFCFTYLLWMTDAFTNRVTFVFYFLPTTPVICIGLGMAFSEIMDNLRSKKFRLHRVTPGMKAAYAGIAFYFLFHLALFLIFNPAIPTFIKTWMPPFSLGMTNTSTVTATEYVTLSLYTAQPLLQSVPLGIIGISGWWLNKLQL